MELARIFTSRTNELSTILDFCQFSESEESRMLLISGQSGTGKSFLLRETFSRLVTNDIVIIQMDLNSDEFTTTMLFESLIYLSWNKKDYNDKYQLQIPEEYAFSKYLNGRKFTKNIISKLLSMISGAVELIPSYGKPLKELIPKNVFEKDKDDPTPDIAVTFFKYLHYLASKTTVYLAIDNYQFLQKNIRLILESHIESVNKNICFIPIIRTLSDSDQLNLPNCFSKNKITLNLNNFSPQETSELVQKLLPYSDNLKIIAEDCFRKTNGNLKEIEYYIASLNYNVSQNNAINIKNLVETLSSLSKIEKYLITIASLFPAGLKMEYVFRLLNNVLLTDDEDKLTSIMQDLIKIGYLYLNGMSHDLMKPAHEKIINSIKAGLTEDEFTEIHRELSDAMESLIDGPVQINDYNYLLHCYVGIFTTSQIKGKIEYVIRLFDIQYKSNFFYYIVSVYKEFKEIINLLPEHTVDQILDACQKTSEFYLGMEILKMIENQKGQLSDSYKLFYVKYLTQTYHFTKALEIIETLKPTEKVQLYHLNILQHLCEDKKAKAMINAINHNSKHTINYYIILRNSAHYFPYETAITHLKTVFNYFQQRGLLFDEATALNNLSVVYLWKNEIEEADRCLIKAIQIFEGLNSNELFEPLCNMGVLEFLRNDFRNAKRFTENALAIVNKSLTLDHIILTSNLLLISLALNEINMEECRGKYYSLFMLSKVVEDPWLHFMVIYNLEKMEKLLLLEPSGEPDNYFIDRVVLRKDTGTEILQMISVKNYGDVGFLFSFSPHWRY